MGINPFGEESDSVHAWKERYKQQEFQTQTLQKTLQKTKSELEELEAEFSRISKKIQKQEEELSETKQELRVFKDLAKERENKIRELQNSIVSSKLSDLEEQNKRLKNQVMDLQGKLARGGQDDQFVSKRLSSALIPYFLHKFDPENPKYQNTYKDLVETAIESNNTITSIIAILVKYGGSGPIDRIEEMVNQNDFYAKIEQLKQEKIIVQVGDEILISTYKDNMMEEANWEELETSKVFDQLINVMKTDSTDVIVSAIENARDTLQEREIPISTIFFEMRKLGERLSKHSIDKKSAIKTIEDWKRKFENLKPEDS